MPQRSQSDTGILSVEACSAGDLRLGEILLAAWSR